MRAEALRRFRRGALWLSIGLCVMGGSAMTQIFASGLYSLVGRWGWIWLTMAPTILSQACIAVAGWIVLAPPLVIGSRGVASAVRATMPVCVCASVLRTLLQRPQAWGFWLRGPWRVDGRLAVAVACEWVWLLCLAYLLAVCLRMVRRFGRRGSGLPLVSSSLVLTGALRSGLVTYFLYIEFTTGRPFAVGLIFAAVRLVSWLSLVLYAALGVQYAVTYSRLRSADTGPRADGASTVGVM